MKSINPSMLIALLILLVVSGLIFGLHPDFNDSNYFSHDFLFHYYKSSGVEFEPNVFIDQSKLDAYPPIVSWIWGLFSFNIRTFYFFTLFVFFVLFGLVLTKISGSWVTALFWVSCSAPFTFLLGTIPQGLVTLMLVFFVFVKFRYRLILLLLGLLTESAGFWLLALYWIIEIILTTKWKNLALGICGGTLFPAKATATQTITEVQAIDTGTSIVGTKGLNMNNYVMVARWLIMYPLLPFGFLGLWKKNKVWFWFSLVLFVGAFVLLYWRIVESAMPFIVLGLSFYYKQSNKKMKLLLIAVSIGLFIIQLTNYFYAIDLIHLSLTTMLTNLPCYTGVLK